LFRREKGDGLTHLCYTLSQGLIILHTYVQMAY
jgi:hypothetical protein